VLLCEHKIRAEDGNVEQLFLVTRERVTSNRGLPVLGSFVP
jgi:hypothetical protein